MIGKLLLCILALALWAAALVMVVLAIWLPSWQWFATAVVAALLGIAAAMVADT